MKLVLILVIFIALVQSVKLSTQNKQLSDKVSSLFKTQQGKLYLQLIQLENTDNQQDLQPLKDALQALYDDLSTKIADQQTDINEEDVRHDTDLATQNQSRKAQIAIRNDAEDALEGTQDLYDGLVRQENKVLDQQKLFKTNYDNAVSELERIQTDYNKEKAELEGAIDLLRRALAEIENARGSTNFLQFIKYNKDQFESISQLFQVKMNSLKLSKLSQEPIKNILAQVDGDKDIQSINKAYGALKDLIDQFKSQLGQLGLAFEEEFNSQKGKGNTAKQQYDELSKVIKRKRDAQARNKETQTEQQNQVNTAKKAIEQIDEFILEENDYYDGQSELLKNQLKDLNKELEIVVQAQEIVNSL